MRIKAKLQVGAFCAIFFALLVGLVLFLTVRRVNDATDSAERAGQIVRGASELNVLTRSYLQFHHERPLTQWKLKYASLGRLLAEAGGTGEVEGNVIRRISENFKELEPLLDRISSNFDKMSRLSGMERSMLEESNERLVSILMAKTQRVSNDATLLIRESYRVIRTAERRALFVVIVAAVLLVLALSSIFLLLNKGISSSLQKLKKGTETIAAGDLEHHINVTSRDEIGELAVAFNKMTNDLKDSYGQLQNEIQTRKKTERELRVYAAELKRSNTELEQFAYVASHDLQEPLRMVASFTQLLASRYGGKLGTEADEFIHYAVEGANRMQRLINDLLAYSRVGTRGLAFQTTDCNAALAEARLNLQFAIEDARAVLTHDELPAVTADSRQLTQLFQNLIGNAIKFHADDLPSVHISAKKNGGEWIFSVRDNGIGIETQYKERIFGIFQRLHGPEEYSGTGIGLAICKKIVERHGGRIWVESEPGKGSVFYFALPERGVAS